MGKISVIVPVYKVEPYIHRCVDSILAQSFSDFELILVDDGSPDRCGEICEEYAVKDSRIHVIHQENGGLSAARNSGIDWAFAHSDSRWLAFIDSDDWVHRDYLKILLTAAQENQVKMAVCDMIRSDTFREDEPIRNLQVFAMAAEQAYVKYYGMCLAAWRKIFAKELFASLRFPVGKLHEDCYTTHIPLFAAGRVTVCDVPLYYYYTNPGSITRSRWKPKRLEEIDAHEHRLAWLQEHGLSAAVRREMGVYGDVLLEQAEILLELSKESAEFTPYLVQVRQKLRRLLKQEDSVDKLEFDQGRLWVMLMAYSGGNVFRLLRQIQKRKNNC